MPAYLIAIVAAITAAVVFVVFCFILNAFVFRSILMRPKRAYHVKTAGDDVRAEEKRRAQECAEWAETVPHAEYTIPGERKVALYGLYLDRGADRTVVLAHGYKATGKSRMYNARFYYETGYNVLVIDHPGHGKSGGKYISMGYTDSLDLLRWVDFLEKEKGMKKIVLDGVSMGGATVLSTSLWPRRNSVKAIVSDCAFTSAADEFRYQMKGMKTPAWLVLPFVGVYARIFGGFPLDRGTPLEAVKKSVTPTLFIHGESDEFVPVFMGKRLYEANASEKELLITENVPHALSYILAEEAYKKAIERFLERALAENA